MQDSKQKKLIKDSIESSSELKRKKDVQELVFYPLAITI
jgi:hypothetical protein